MPPVLLLTLAILTPAAVGTATLLLPRRMLALRVLASVLAPAASLALLIAYLAQHGFDATVPAVEWMPQLHLNWALHADRFALFFALLIAAVGLLVAVYTRAYFGPDLESLYRF